MAIPLSTLRAAASRPHESLANSLNEARQLRLKTAFLCHSHLDRDLVLGLLRRLQDAKWQVYVDWQDASMPSTPIRETASKIKDRIKAAQYFLFLATPNSTTSRWCPWEIGYADGEKSIESIFIVPTVDDNGRYYGNEYLQLYKKIDQAAKGGLGVFEPGKTQGVALSSI